MFNDTYYTNRYIAEVGGVTLANINDLERYFMQVIDWNINISTEEFQFYERSINMFLPSQDTSSATSSIQQSAAGSPHVTAAAYPFAQQQPSNAALL
mmetsp:Transcript_33186/g.41049  ORF Transcript_33186/g.41049 Transcript_33186/m.41049 type:complete len:97 (-) Transcript_33186:796-1086(-)